MIQTKSCYIYILKKFQSQHEIFLLLENLYQLSFKDGKCFSIRSQNPLFTVSSLFSLL